ncbi:phosphoglycolate phosphatase [Albidovulum inexpectatum]|uniref:Phosphoglycolate phosphatase n=1 Tax=Albidovulum inexpectatum TaxID=196587 RepID=A0A2S5JG62_9RHOB|nr:HAD-IA family hydrolase [Albidovulum inexpectatum]PPB80409.1 phosphoglycolate phosphatase [Albidovulum inexpectatum]
MRLIVFDVDGTLVDSQNHIVAAMVAAFGAVDLPAPDRQAILSIVGLSLPQAVWRLAPDLSEQTRAAIVMAYRNHFAQGHACHLSPLFAGAREALDSLAARDDVFLGIATGKSRRGLDRLLDAYDLRGYFVTAQVADDHPSKPHPSMLRAALAETGVDAQAAVMVGDTTYDVEMARNAGIAAIGVSWGYHAADALREAGASAVLDDFNGLVQAVEQIWESA